MKRLNTNLKELRQQERLSLEALAWKVGVTKETIRHIERGESVPNVFLAMRIAAVFQMDVEELFKPVDKKES